MISTAIRSQELFKAPEQTPAKKERSAGRPRRRQLRAQPFACLLGSKSHCSEWGFLPGKWVGLQSRARGRRRCGVREERPLLAAFKPPGCRGREGVAWPPGHWLEAATAALVHKPSPRSGKASHPHQELCFVFSSRHRPACPVPPPLGKAAPVLPKERPRVKHSPASPPP